MLNAKLRADYVVRLRQPGREQLLQLRNIVRMHQVKGIFPNQLLRLIPERMLNRRTDKAPGAVTIQHGDNVRGDFYQRAQPLFILSQRFLGLLSLRDITHDSCEETLTVFSKFSE